MSTSKNKFWSLVFGAILANSYVWLIEFGVSAPVPEALHQHPSFIFEFYSPMVTACLSALLAGVLSFIMLKAFDVCVSEHILWLFWPTLGFIVFTAFTANILIASVLQAAIPAMFMLSLIYYVRKRQQFRMFQA
jgi:hypothetical protein